MYDNPKPMKKYKMTEPDYEGQMAKSQLYKTAKYAKEIMHMLDNETQLPAWVQSKITKIADYIGAVKHYLEGENIDGVVHTVEIVEDSHNKDSFVVVVMNKDRRGYAITDAVSKKDAINVARSTSPNRNQLVKVFKYEKALNNKKIKMK